MTDSYLFPRGAWEREININRIYFRRRRAVNAITPNGIPAEHVLIVAAVLFVLGMTGVLIRRDLIFVLLSLEVMLNAAGLAFVAAASRWVQPDGQIMFILILAVAAAEVSLGLALILRIYSRHGTLDADRAGKLRG